MTGESAGVAAEAAAGAAAAVDATPRRRRAVLAAGATEVRWAPRVPRHAIRRLYETDALGIVDEEQIADVGYALLARCQSILRATEAHKGRIECPRCGARVNRAGSVWKRSLVLTCAGCGWATTWGAYYDTYRCRQLTGGSALGVFEWFTRSFPGPTPRASMLAIDRLLHTFHHELTAPTRPAGVNVVEGTLEDVLDFLNALTYAAPRAATGDPPDGAAPDAAARQGFATRGPGDERAGREEALARARVGHRLRLLRQRARLTGRALGTLVGMLPSRISEIETGRRPPSAREVERLLEALDASSEERDMVTEEAARVLARGGEARGGRGLRAKFGAPRALR